MTEEPDPIDVHVGSRLRDMRTSRRLSMDALGKRVGVSYQQIQKYETGFNRISASALWRVAGVLGVGVGWFFDGLDKTPGDIFEDAETVGMAAALCRVDPAIRREVCGLIDALVSASERQR